MALSLFKKEKNSNPVKKLDQDLKNQAKTVEKKPVEQEPSGFFQSLQTNKGLKEREAQLNEIEKLVTLKKREVDQKEKRLNEKEQLLKEKALILQRKEEKLNEEETNLESKRKKLDQVEKEVKKESQNVAEQYKKWHLQRERLIKRYLTQLTEAMWMCLSEHRWWPKAITFLMLRWLGLYQQIHL